jgi:hypothetical protein
VGLEACPLSEWLDRRLVADGFKAKFGASGMGIRPSAAACSKPPYAGLWKVILGISVRVNVKTPKR